MLSAINGRDAIPNPSVNAIVETTRPEPLYHASPSRNLRSILDLGLRPARSSHRLRDEVVHLTNQLGLAVRYAEQGFGTNGNEPWVILEVDMGALDQTQLRPDWDSDEAARRFIDLVACGYSPEQVRLGDYPWSVGLEAIGLIMYVGPISPSALKVVDGPRLF